jgi:hypothetical protein
MANIAAAQSGNFNLTTTWVGGAVPGSGDIAYANTFTITISDTRTVQAVSNAAVAGITVGGTFSLLNGANLTCTNANGVVQGGTATSCITTSGLTAGSSAIVAASINVNAAGQGSCVVFSSSGTLSWVGNLNSGTTVCPFVVSGTGVLNFTGDIYSAGGGTQGGMQIASNCAASITGNLYGISGNQAALWVSSSASNANVTFTGGVYGGGGTAYGLQVSGSSTVTVNGPCQSGTTTAAVAVGAASQITRLSGPFLLGASGNINPVIAASWRWNPTQTPTYIEVVASNGTTKRNLYTADNMPSGGYPTQNNTRSGTIYGPNNEFTGTLAVPSPSSVALGVATDNTVGTAILTAANIRTAVGLASANLDTQFTNIPTAVWNALTSALTTASSIGKLLVDNINATISSRLASSSYTAPLDAAETRTAVGLSTANLDTQLGNIPTNVWSALTSALSTAGSVGKLLVDNINATISSRLASSAYTSPLDASGTRSALGLASANLDTQISNIPTASVNASAVRTELTTELSRIDTTISSRLPSSSYTAPLDAAGVRSALGLASANLDTQISNIPGNNWSYLSSSATTVGSLGKLLVDNVNASISSRLPSSSYISPLDAAGTRSALGLASANLDTQITNIPSFVWSNTTRTITGGTVDTLINAPIVPTPAEIASQVRTELNTELGRIDTPISSRLDPSGTLARVTLVDTVTTLTNAPIVPSAEEISLQVRTELSTELARIDTTISSRLASADYVLAPTTSEIRTELSTELARIDTTISSRLASADYVLAPTTSEIRTELSTELARIDTTISSRLASADYVLAPTTSEIRTELSTELARIDTTISSRLASVDYVDPPTPPEAAIIATAVREELSPELARLANCATVDTTIATIQDALPPRSSTCK